MIRAVPPRRAPSEPPVPQERWEFTEAEHGVRVDPAHATLGLGAFALLLTGAAWTAPLGWLAWFDLPLAFLLFVASAWIALLEPRRIGAALPGVIACGAAVAIAVVHLFAAPAHPWLR